MDYSLLVGIHYRDRANVQAIGAAQRRSTVQNVLGELNRTSSNDSNDIDHFEISPPPQQLGNGQTQEHAMPQEQPQLTSKRSSSIRKRDLSGIKPKTGALPPLPKNSGNNIDDNSINNSKAKSNNNNNGNKSVTNKQNLEL